MTLTEVAAELERMADEKQAWGDKADVQNLLREAGCSWIEAFAYRKAAKYFRNIEEKADVSKS